MDVIEIDSDGEEKKMGEYILFQIPQNPRSNSVDPSTGIT